MSLDPEFLLGSIYMWADAPGEGYERGVSLSKTTGNVFWWL